MDAIRERGQQIAVDLTELLQVDRVRVCYTAAQAIRMAIPPPRDGSCRFVVEWKEVRQHCPISLAVLADDAYEQLVKQIVIELWLDRLQALEQMMLRGQSGDAN